jgi:RNA polymerase sigma factor (sigma-70 family)
MKRSPYFPEKPAMPPDDHSVTRWIDLLKADDPAAARALWERFVEQMLQAARQRLGGRRRAADEEDVVISAFERFLHGVKQGRFPKLDDRNDLWNILFTLTRRHAVRQLRDENRLCRGNGQVRGDSAFEPAIQAQVHAAPGPEEIVEMQENLAKLLDALGDESLKKIALARMEGFSNVEIARQIGRSEVTVERRLKLIRAIWRPEEADNFLPE